MKVNTFINVILVFLYIATLIICGLPDFSNPPTIKGVISVMLIILGMVGVISYIIISVIKIRRDYGDEDIF